MIQSKGCDETDPSTKQDSENEDDEFLRIQHEIEYREKEKIRNLVVWPGY
jgi:hypothetical protein